MLTAIRKWLRLDPEPNGVPFQAPIFIVGCMRSGTTFLVDKMTQHPQLLKVGAELRNVWTTIGGAPCEVGTACEYRKAADVSPVYVSNMTRYFTDYIQQSQGWRHYLMRTKNWVNTRQGRIFYDWDQVIPVNKSTHFPNKITYLHEMFPEARFVFIIRDIRGQSASMKKFVEKYARDHQKSFFYPEDPNASWSIMPTDSLRERAYPGDFQVIPQMWMRLNHLALSELATLPAHLTHIVSYEALVKNQALVLGELMNFLKLSPRHEAETARIVSAPYKLINTSTKGDPLEKWKRDLTDNELSQIDQLLLDERDKYAYICSQIAQKAT